MILRGYGRSSLEFASPIIWKNHLEGSALSSFEKQSSSDCLLASSSLLISWLPRSCQVPLAKRTEGCTVPILSVGRLGFEALGRYSHACTSLRMRSHWVCSITRKFLVSYLMITQKPTGCTCPILTGPLFWALGIFPFWADTHMMRYYKVSKGLWRNYLRLPLWKAWLAYLGLVAYSKL